MKKKMGNKPRNNRKPSNRKEPQFSKRQREIESMDMRENDRVPNPHESQPNDWRWYAANPQLVKDYASFPFGFPVGTTYPTDSIGAGTSTPGIMAFYFTPVFGDLSAKETAPLNIAMRKFYTFVRHENSGAKNYEAPDLMMYYMAMDSCYTYWSFLKRIVGLLPQYTPYNKYWPKVLIEQMGVDFDSISQNVADFRGYVNQFGYRLNSTRVPASFAYTARHMWMCDGIYTDSNTTKAQCYFYTPAQYWKFNPTLTEGNVGGLELVNFLNPANIQTMTRMTLEQIVEFGEDLLNPIISNEDMNIMSGDILKAFGENGCVHIAPIDSNYTVLPVYSTEVSSQIENLFIYPALLSGSIQQATAVGTGYLTYSNTITSSGEPTTSNLLSLLGSNVSLNVTNIIAKWRMVNFHNDGVTPEEVMVATRLANIPNAIQGTGTYANNIYLDMTTAGSEVVVGSTISRINDSNLPGVIPTSYYNITSVPVTAITAENQDSFLAVLGNTLNVLAMLTDFDWAPNITPYWEDSRTSGGTFSMSGYTLDVDNYTYLNQYNLSKLSEVALLNMLSV